jgi:hypothetical protein
MVLQLRKEFVSALRTARRKSAHPPRPRVRPELQALEDRELPGSLLMFFGSLAPPL